MTRKAGTRDSSLIVIASEGERTEPEYFEALRDEYYNSRIQVIFLHPSDSAPKYVIDELNQYKKEFGLNLKKGDELWVLIDKDRWDRFLNEIAEECRSNEFHLALSNPCFEIWLLLHLKNLSQCTRGDRDLICRDKQSLKQCMMSILQSYTGAGIQRELLLPHVRRAITYARALDANPQDRWPLRPGTRVYLVAEKIIRM